MELDSCHNLSMDALSPVLLGLNPLDNVRLTNCREIHRKDVERYRKRLRGMKLDKAVKVDWL